MTISRDEVFIEAVSSQQVELLQPKIVTLWSSSTAIPTNS